MADPEEARPQPQPRPPPVEHQGRRGRGTPARITFAHAHLRPHSLERRRFTRSPHTRGPSSTSAPAGLRPRPPRRKARRGGGRPGRRPPKGGPARPALAEPEAETHLQAGAPTERRQTLSHTLRTRLGAWMTSRVSVTHAGESPPSAEAPLRSLVSASPGTLRGWGAPASSKAARAHRAPFGPAPSVKRWERAGQTCAGPAGSAHLVPGPPRGFPKLLCRS